MQHRTPRLAAIVFGLVTLAAPVQAKQTFPHMPTTAELSMLPDYCQARMGTDQALRDRWNKRMGPDKFMHLHHYCHGLKDMNRAGIASDSRVRRDLLQSAIGQFAYVIQRWPADFELTIQARERTALARLMLGLHAPPERRSP